jgi:hypothetical protein
MKQETIEAAILLYQSKHGGTLEEIAAIFERVVYAIEDVQLISKCDFNLRCVMCQAEAITTAAQIPVCGEHYREYSYEASQNKPDRPFFHSLIIANGRAR